MALLQELISVLHAAQIISRNLTASLTFLAWDICITIDQEVEYIWLTPDAFWGIKAVYLFLRYFALFSLIATQGVSAHFAHIIPVPLHSCRSVFLFRIISIVLITIAADIIFMVRVYALYKRRVWVAVIMASLLAVETIACALLIPYTLRRVTFNPFCYITLPTHINVAFSLLFIMPPITAFAFIAVKQVTSIRDGWGRLPLMVLLTRDSAWAIVGLAAVWLTNPLIAIFIGKRLAHVGHLWFISIVPSIGCRVILNMQLLKDPTEATATNDFQLTTAIAGFQQDSYQMRSLKSQGYLQPQPQGDDAISKVDANEEV